MLEEERESERSRPSMLSVPARWRELYFTVFFALCVAGMIFLVWYEIYRRDAESDYADIIMNVLLNTGPVAMAAAIAAFIILKGRDTMLSTWETFAKRRYERGREDEREAQAKRIAEIEDELKAQSERNAELEKRNAELEEALSEQV